MPAREDLEIVFDGGVCRATLNRPETGNALSPALVDQLSGLVAQCTQSRIHTLVINGNGRHFCTGVDLTNLAEETDDSLLARFIRIELLLQAVHRAPFATMAIAHGKVAGAGADLFAACNQRSVAPNTSFRFPGAIGFGLILGSRRLAALVGADLATDWVSSGRWIDETEALASGFASGRHGEELPTPVAPKLDPFTRQQLRVAMHASSVDDVDLGLLARSAAGAGLKARITAYAASTKPEKNKT